MVLLHCKHDTLLWTAASHYSFVYNILTIGTCLTPRYTIIALLLCLVHTRERHDTCLDCLHVYMCLKQRLFTCSHVYIVYVHSPQAVQGCWNARKQYTVAQPFRTSFCPQTKNENKLRFGFTEHLHFVHLIIQQICIQLNKIHKNLLQSI